MFKKWMLLSTLSVLTAAPASAVVIDDFGGVSGAVASGFSTPGTATADQQPGEIILGGERDLRADFTGGNTFESVVISTGNNTTTAGGTLSTLVHSVGGNSRGTSLLIYDGEDNDTNTVNFNTGLNGFDGTSAGADNGLRINIVNSDRAIPITAYVFTSDSQWSFFRFNTPTDQIPDPITGFLPDPLRVVMEYSSFTSGAVAVPTLANGGGAVPLMPNTLATSGADFTNINAIALLIDSNDQDGIDLTFDLLATNNIPVPGSALLLLPGAFLIWRRRKS